MFANLNLAADSKPSLPLLQLPAASQASKSAADFAGLLSTFLPLQVHQWEGVAGQGAFINTAGFHHLNGLTILSTHGTAVWGDLEQKQDAQLIMAYGYGEHRYQLQHKDYCFNDAALFVPATQNRVQINSSICSAVVINVSPDSLFPIAAAMTGPVWDRLSFHAVLEQPVLLFRRGDSRRQHLLALLEQTLVYVEQCLMIGSGIHPNLQLDDLIRRLIIMLLFPDLLESAHDSAAAPSLISGRVVHQDLIDWLLAHLHEPISLSCIEARSHYSRRSLQYAFKRQFGCGPMQWLRRQRLARARELLIQASKPIAIHQVAQACGYLSQASFSRDFLERYGESPSRLLRRSLGRRRSP